MRYNDINKKMCRKGDDIMNENEKIPMLTHVETLIMKQIWDYGGDMPLLKLIEILRDDESLNYARTTVSTFLLKLSNKRFISTIKVGRTTQIHPLITMDDYCGELFRGYLEFWFDNSVYEMMRCMAEDELNPEKTRRDARKVMEGLLRYKEERRNKANEEKEVDEA